MIRRNIKLRLNPIKFWIKAWLFLLKFLTMNFFGCNLWLFPSPSLSPC
uniref:Uncharacterized protein n=1 Tax=Rhizophora mucronata TaxID=61149 RepID=A0A2P2PFA8_RHIMU